MTDDRPDPGDRRPAVDGDRRMDGRPTLDRPPGDRYVRPEAAAIEAGMTPIDRVAWPIAIVLGTAIAFTILGGLLTVTAGLVVVAAFAGWLAGKVVSPPPRAAVIGLAAVALGLLGIWLYSRLEGGVLGPVDYLAEVEGPIVVVLTLLAGGGMAAAASR